MAVTLVENDNDFEKKSQYIIWLSAPLPRIKYLSSVIFALEVDCLLIYLLIKVGQIKLNGILNLFYQPYYLLAVI